MRRKGCENIDGVKGVFSASGQLQIIIGTGEVNKVYDEFIKIAGITAASKDDVKAAAAAKQNVFKRAIKTLGDIFVPIIPAIVASGFLMGIMEALNFMVNNGYLNLDTSGSIYVFANLFANTAYTFLPILIAFSAAKAFGGNPYLGAVIGMIMIQTACNVRIYILTAVGIRCKYCTGCSCFGSRIKDKEQEDKGCCNSFCNVLLYGYYRTGNLRCKP